MAFLARKVKKGLFEIEGLEAFVEGRLAELKKALGLLKGGGKAKAAVEVPAAPVVPAPAPAPRASAPAKPPVKAARPARGKAKAAGKAAKPVPAASVDPAAEALARALAAHPHGKAVVKAGQQKDQLLRALVPLYLLKGQKVEVTSGVTSKFWAAHGVTFAAPNAAKVLREHKGYARRGAQGLVIEAKGVAYVEAALK